MGKGTKIALRYRNGALPEKLSEILSNADENDLRILVGVMMLADRENGTVAAAELPALLEMDKAEVDASLKFWRGAGVLGNVAADKPAKSEEPTKKKEQSEKKPSADITREGERTAHRNGALERSGTLENYSSAELAALMEKRAVSAQFVDEAQRVMGKLFRVYDTGILVGIVDQLGFEEEAVLAMLAYAAGRGKKTLRYTEQLAMAFYDEGVTDTAAVLERIGRMERSGEVMAKVKTLFGVGSRELTTTEKRLFTAWTEKFAYDLEVIRMAYDITVDSIQKPAPKYTNSILEKWNAEGLRTAEEVASYLEKKKADCGATRAGAVTKSYDVEEFFEAALQRSYEELQ